MTAVDEPNAAVNKGVDVSDQGIRRAMHASRARQGVYPLIGIKVDGASKKCADATWNQIVGCDRFGFAGIVLRVQICQKSSEYTFRCTFGRLRRLAQTRVER